MDAARGPSFAADQDEGPQRGSGRPIPPLVSKIQVATTNAGARAEGGLTPDFLALSPVWNALYIVQVGTSADLDGIVPTVIELVIHAHAAQSGMGGLEAIQVITLGSPWRLRALRKKALAAATSRVRLR